MFEYVLAGIVGVVIGAIMGHIVGRRGIPKETIIPEEITNRMEGKSALLVGVKEIGGAPNARKDAKKKALTFAVMNLNTGKIDQPVPSEHLNHDSNTRVDVRDGVPVLVNAKGEAVDENLIICHDVIHYWRFGTGTCECYWSGGSHVHECW